MRIPKSVRDNLRFLVVEIDSQLALLHDFFSSPNTAAATRIIDRAGYSTNLKTRIHAGCLKRLASDGDSAADAQALRALELVATELDRISELCRDCVGQSAKLRDLSCLEPKAYEGLLKRIRQGIALVEPALESRDSRLALKIADVESRIDRDYHKLVRRYIRELKQKRHTEDLTHALFVAHSLDAMGDALLDVSESVISANLGQTVDLERYHSLQASVGQLPRKKRAVGMQIEPIAETRSGSAISGITTNGAKNDTYLAIFKDGVKSKVKEERQGVENWHDIYPGLAPKILSYKKRGRSAALLIEHLPGTTFEQILISESEELLDQALEQLSRTLKSIWRETRTDRPVSAGFTEQLMKRLDEVYKIHPEFRQGTRGICGFEVASFRRLSKRAARLEARLKAPFSVYIHGDFNVDNIIYDPVEKRINFIDLHRSRYMDYVQDVSVFMVSNYRMQIFDTPIRRRILRLATDFYAIASKYATKNRDETFELRLALGLARSFATSTRFILDKSLARAMFMRARYLIEQVLAADLGKPAAFKTPVKEIFVG